MQVAFDMDVAQSDYLTVFMDRVSRSFAIVVKFLENPLRDYVSTAYLICRVIDNIEDCHQPVDWKQARFREVSQLLDNSNRTEPILRIWQGESWPGLGPDQIRLMTFEEGKALWEIYSEIPESFRASIRRWSQAMADGMQGLEDLNQPPDWARRDGVRILSREKDYNDYCYIVAGTVGHMVTELAAWYYDLDENSCTSLDARAEMCGRGLQKTNILKDFAEDLERGVCYLPDEWMREAGYLPLLLQGAPTGWNKMVIGDVIAELQGSVDYILALPYHARGYRMASLLSLLPALQTVYLAAQMRDTLFTPDHHVKISRAVMAQCVTDANRMLFDNRAVVDYSQEIKSAIDVLLG